MMSALQPSQRGPHASYAAKDKLLFCKRHGLKTHRGLKCDAALCLGCKHYDINRRLWCAGCAAPYRQTLLGFIMKNLFKTAMVVAVFAGTAWLAAMTLRRGLVFGGFAAAALGMKLFWPSHRIDRRRAWRAFIRMQQR